MYCVHGERGQCRSRTRRREEGAYVMVAAALLDALLSEDVACAEEEACAGSGSA